MRPTAHIGHVGQEAPGGPQSLLETVIESNKELSALTREAETATEPNQIAEIHTRLADIGAHTAEARAASILAGLGFDTERPSTIMRKLFRWMADARGACLCAL